MGYIIQRMERFFLGFANFCMCQKIGLGIFCFCLSIVGGLGKVHASEVDSLAYFDQQFSFQSRVPIDRQLEMTWDAERYALAVGDTFKSYKYVSHRAYLHFLSDNDSMCMSVNAGIIPQIDLQISRSDEDKWKCLLVDCYANTALCLVYQEMVDSAILIYQSLLNRFESDPIPYLTAKVYNGMGIAFAYRQIVDVAHEYFEKALSEYEKIDDKRGIFLACSNMGALYLTQSDYQSALPYCTRAHQVARQEGYLGQERLSVALSMGYIYMGLGQSEIADPYLLEAYTLSRAGNYHHYIGFADVAYAKNLYRLGRFPQALSVAQAALDRIEGQKRYTLQVDLLDVLSKVTKAQGNIASSLAYLERYVAVRDTIIQLENRQAILQMEYQYEQLKKEKSSEMRIRELELVRAKAQNRTLWIVVLGIFICALIVFLFWLRKRMKNLHAKADFIKEESRRHLQNAELQLEGKNKELASNALRFMRLNNLQSSILEELKKLKTTFALRGKEKMAVCQIEELARQIASEKEWQEFNFYFEQVDKEFLKKLTEKFPDLTANEKHLCVLFNLGLSNKDIANLTGKTLQSVGMAKFRLKTKFGLENSEDIASFLQSL